MGWYVDQPMDLDFRALNVTIMLMSVRTALRGGSMDVDVGAEVVDSFMVVQKIGNPITLSPSDVEMVPSAGETVPSDAPFGQPWSLRGTGTGAVRTPTGYDPTDCCGRAASVTGPQRQSTQAGKPRWLTPPSNAFCSTCFTLRTIKST